jgi:hypothetical protein
MEIAGPLMNGFSAIPAFEGSRRWLRPLFLRGRVVHAARTGKMDGYLGAIAHPLLCNAGMTAVTKKYFTRGGGAAGRNYFVVSSL